MDELQDLKNEVEELRQKIESYENVSTIPEQLLNTLQDKGFVRIERVLETPFQTLDSYDSKYYYMFSTINGSRFVFSNINALDFTIIASISTSTDVFTANAHGFNDGDAFTFWTTGTAPSPLQNGGTYYVRDSSTNTFKLASTLGGAAIDVTSNGNGTHYLQRINILF